MIGDLIVSKSKIDSVRSLLALNSMTADRDNLTLSSLVIDRIRWLYYLTTKLIGSDHQVQSHTEEI